MAYNQLDNNNDDYIIQIEEVHGGSHSPQVIPQGYDASTPLALQRDLYPAWSSDAPVSTEEFENIFYSLQNILRFHKDNIRNICEDLMMKLDSFASRMTPTKALLTL